MLMTREQIEDRMMDYLYEELSDEERSAFETAVTAYPDLQEEISAFRNTRTSFESLPEIEVSHLVKANILREARIAVAESEASFFERLTSMLMRPAMGTAFAAVLVAGVGLIVIDKGGVFQHEEETRISPAEEVSRETNAPAPHEEELAEVDSFMEEREEDLDDDLAKDVVATVVPSMDREAPAASSPNDTLMKAEASPAPKAAPAPAAASPKQPATKAKRKREVARAKKPRSTGQATGSAPSAPPPGLPGKKGNISSQDSYGAKNAYGLGSGGGAPRADGNANLAQRRQKAAPKKSETKKAPMKEMAPIAVQEKAAPPSTSYVAPASDALESDGGKEFAPVASEEEPSEGKYDAVAGEDETAMKQSATATKSVKRDYRNEALNNKNRSSTRTYIQYLRTTPEAQTTKALVEAYELALKTGPLSSAQWILSKLEKMGFDPTRLAKMKSALKKKQEQKTAK